MLHTRIHINGGLQQVRTLEAALDRGFDLNRRLHGWARPGIAMDRDDFIDLAEVSKEIPGKTPAQVIHSCFAEHG